MIRRFENQLQDFRPAITLPYWNSSNDRGTDAALWNNGFMGQFNAAWNLGRALGPKPTCANLPTQQQVQTNRGRGTYDVFWPELENPIHNGPHCWVGGEMNQADSPHAPVFYLHPCWIDKLWAMWQIDHPGAPFVSSGQGFGLNDPLMEWPNRTPASVIDHHALGYSYDSED
jgi:tyrosinase